MHGNVESLVGGLPALDEELEREFETRLQESSGLAFRVAFSVVRHRQNAEDVAQEAFVKAYRKFRQLRDRDRFRSWLVRMTWRLALDRNRADRRRVNREREALRNTQVAGSSRSQLWDAIDALPPKLRLVIVLANVDGHGLRDVARLLGVPEGTVKSRLYLARRRLKELLHA